MAITAKTLQAETERTCHSHQQQLRRMHDMREKALAIKSDALRAGRTMTKDEEDTAVSYLTESNRIGDMPGPVPHRPMPQYYDDDRLEAAAAEWVDQHGRRRHVLRPQQRVADLPQPDNKSFHPLHLGRAICGLVSGQWGGARAERLAMNEGGNVQGGFLVNDAFSWPIIDLARAKARCIEAGARTMIWPTDQPSDTLSVARVISDPTFQVVGESQEIPKSEPAFDRIIFDPVKIAVIVPMSRELVEDAPNAADMVQEVLVKAFAAELDRLGLVGSLRPVGLLNRVDANKTGSVGTIDWLDISAAATLIRQRNFEPNAMIASPATGAALDTITSGDGTNAARLWLGPPPNLDSVKRLTTSNCPDAVAFLGAFDQMVFCIRSAMNLEVSTTAGQSFELHQLWIKLVARVDVGTLHGGAFQILTDISTSA